MRFFVGQLRDFDTLAEELNDLEMRLKEFHHQLEDKPNFTTYLAFVAEQLVEITAIEELKYIFTPVVKRSAAEIAVKESMSYFVVVINVTLGVAVEAIDFTKNKFHLEAQEILEMSSLYFHP